jgi:hypothetical protein
MQCGNSSSINNQIENAFFRPETISKPHRKFEEAVSTKCVIGTSTGMQGVGMKTDDVAAVSQTDIGEQV